MKKKGFSTVELIVSFVIVSLIAIAMFGTVVDLLDRIDRYQNTTRLSIINGIIKNNIEEDFKYRKLYGINACGCNCYDFVFQDMSVKRLSVDTLKNTIKYDKYTSKIPDAYYVGGALVNKTSFDTEEGKYDRIIRISVPITEKSTERSVNMNIVYQYNSRDRGNLNVFPDRLSGIGGYSCTLGYNIPILADGMTPIKWNGLSWIDTTEDDEEWYSYDEADKKWANAKTADGSMWVWIPRYVYKISSGWHTSGYSGGMPGAGTIDIQWSMGTDDTRGGLITLDAGTGAAASNNKWTSHPAFTFGDAELTGIWVAKFEASGTTNAIDIKPNVSSLRDLSVNAIFIATRNMETNSRYGWGTSGTGIDTHLMKNIEWGAVAYLAQSTYGKNAEVRRNNSSTFITGCAGLTSTYAGCENAYNTPIGLEASTTGNIYGIYDMSGGAHEYTAAYIDNSYADDTGLSLYNADLKYKDKYDATNDSLEGNYNNAINKKGDAVYETSGSAAGEEAWNFDQAYMPYASNPWFLRGGSYENGADCGVFNFYSTIFAATNTRGFRPVLAIIDEPPTITIAGDNPAIINVGNTYEDAGATALDDIDGDITNRIQVTSDVDTSTTGTYTVTYNVTDSGGNAATPVVRTVHVVTTLFNLTYGGSQIDSISSIIATSDGGYLLGGHTSSTDGDITGGNKGGSDCWVVKINNSGAIEWNKTYGGSSTDYCYFMEETSDGGYLLSGYTKSSDGDITDGNSGGTDFLVLKLNSSGVLQWNRTYGGSSNETLYSMIKTNDGGFLLGGTTQSGDGDVTDGNNGWIDYWVVKINNNGGIQWNRTYGGTQPEVLYSMIKTSDGGFLLGGYAVSTDGDVTGGNKGSSDAWVVKINSSGTIQWNKTYGGSNGEDVRSIVETSDGGYLLGCNTNSSDYDVTDGNNGTQDLWVVKINSSGTIQWNKTYGGSNIDAFPSFQIQKLSDGGYLIGGSTQSNDYDVTDGNNGGYDWWLIKINSSGAIQWNKTYGGSNNDSMRSIMQFNNDNYLLFGASASSDGDVINGNKGSNDAWLLEIKENGALN